MKKVFIALGVLFLTTSAFIAGKNFNTKLLPPPAPVCFDYSNMQPNKMDKSIVLGMIRNYYQKQYQAINRDAVNMQLPNVANLRHDSRAIFFNLDTLKRLIYYIEKSATNFNATTKANLGVNIYFASYPRRTPATTINGINYTNRHTLVFVPAVFSGSANPAIANNSMARDFDMLQNLAFPQKTEPFYVNLNMFNTPVAMSQAFGAAGITTTTSTSMGTQNHGTGTPPPESSSGTGNVILDITDPN